LNQASFLVVGEYRAEIVHFKFKLHSQKSFYSVYFLFIVSSSIMRVDIDAVSKMITKFALLHTCGAMIVTKLPSGDAVIVPFDSSRYHPLDKVTKEGEDGDSHEPSRMATKKKEHAEGATKEAAG
jgi:hypothetical protein